MKQTKEAFEKDVIKFFNHFNEFKSIIYKKSYTIDNIELIQLFKIFMDHHEYNEVIKDD
jgi:hypothetical protein